MDSINIQICLTLTSLLTRIVHTLSSAVGFCASGGVAMLLLKQHTSFLSHPGIWHASEDFIWIFNAFKLVVIEKLPKAKQSGSRWKNPGRHERSLRFSPLQRRLVNIHPILLSFYSLFNQGARRDGKIATFNEYVRALIQLSPLSFVETHFYSWSQSSVVMTLHTYVSFVKLQQNGN